MAVNEELVLGIKVPGADKAAQDLQKVRSGVAGVGTAAGNTGKDFDTLEKAGKAAFSTVEKAAIAAGVAVGGIAGASLVVTGGFEKTLSEVGAVLNATGGQTQALEKRFRDLGASTAFSAKEVAEAGLAFARSGQDATATIGLLDDALNLAAAGNVSIADAAKITGAMVNTFFNGNIAEAARVTDVLAKGASSSALNMTEFGTSMSRAAQSASVAGMSLEQTAAIIATLSKDGANAEYAASAVRIALRELSQETGETKKFFEETGIAIRGTDGSLRNFYDIVRDIRATGMEPLTASVRAFGGEAGPVLAGLIQKGTSNAEALQVALEGAGGTAERMSKQMMDNMPGAFEELKGAMEEAMLVLGRDSGLSEALAITMKQAAGAIGDALKGIDTDELRKRLLTAFADVVDASNSLYVGVSTVWEKNKAVVVGFSDEMQKIISRVGPDGLLWLVLAGASGKLVTNLGRIGALVASVARVAGVATAVTGIAELVSKYDLDKGTASLDAETITKRLEKVKAAIADLNKAPLQNDLDAMATYIEQLDYLTAQETYLEKNLALHRKITTEAGETGKELGAQVERIRALDAISKELRAASARSLSSGGGGNNGDRTSTSDELWWNQYIADEQAAMARDLLVFEEHERIKLEIIERGYDAMDALRQADVDAEKEASKTREDLAKKDAEHLARTMQSVFSGSMSNFGGELGNVGFRTENFGSDLTQQLILNGGSLELNNQQLAALSGSVIQLNSSIVHAVTGGSREAAIGGGLGRLAGGGIGAAAFGVPGAIIGSMAGELAGGITGALIDAMQDEEKRLKVAFKGFLDRSFSGSLDDYNSAKQAQEYLDEQSKGIYNARQGDGYFKDYSQQDAQVSALTGVIEAAILAGLVDKSNSASGLAQSYVTGSGGALYGDNGYSSSNADADRIQKFIGGIFEKFPELAQELAYVTESVNKEIDAGEERIASVMRIMDTERQLAEGRESIIEQQIEQQRAYAEMVQRANTEIRSSHEETLRYELNALDERTRAVRTTGEQMSSVFDGFLSQIENYRLDMPFNRAAEQFLGSSGSAQSETIAYNEGGDPFIYRSGGGKSSADTAGYKAFLEQQQRGTLSELGLPPELAKLLNQDISKISASDVSQITAEAGSDVAAAQRQFAALQKGLDSGALTQGEFDTMVTSLEDAIRAERAVIDLAAQKQISLLEIIANATSTMANGQAGSEYYGGKKAKAMPDVEGSVTIPDEALAFGAERNNSARELFLTIKTDGGSGAQTLADMIRSNTNGIADAILSLIPGR